MGYKEFTNAVIKELENRVDGMEITQQEILKTNGQKLHGITIRNCQAKMAPCIYLDEFYENYTKGEETLHDIVEEILQLLEDYPVENLTWDDRLLAYENAKTILHCRIINTARNPQLLQQLAHRTYLDWSIIYSIEFCETPNRDGSASIKVTNNLVKYWGITEEDLYQQAMENLKSEGGHYQSMYSLLTGMTGTAIPDAPDDLMYVLSNAEGLFGASQLLNTEILQKFSKEHGNFYVLPSSLHECILLPDQGVQMGVGELAQMVKEINETEVRECDILSDHVYYYNAETKQLEIVG